MIGVTHVTVLMRAVMLERCCQSIGDVCCVVRVFCRFYGVEERLIGCGVSEWGEFGR